jgi:hypothetical protein
MFTCPDPGLRIANGDSRDRPALLRLSGLGETSDSLVAVVGPRHDRPGKDLIEDGGDGGHARCERHGLAAFQAADDLLQGLPGRRTVIARVLAAVAEDEV